MFIYLIFTIVTFSGHYVSAVFWWFGIKLFVCNYFRKDKLCEIDFTVFSETTTFQLLVQFESLNLWINFLKKISEGARWKLFSCGFKSFQLIFNHVSVTAATLSHIKTVWTFYCLDHDDVLAEYLPVCAKSTSRFKPNIAYWQRPEASNSTRVRVSVCVCVGVNVKCLCVELCWNIFLHFNVSKCPQIDYGKF